MAPIGVEASPIDGVSAPIGVNAMSIDGVSAPIGVEAMSIGVEASPIGAGIFLIGKTAVAGSSTRELPNSCPALCFRTRQRTMGEKPKTDC